MRTSRTGTCSAGFTLFELVVVIFIISLLASVVFPSFLGFGEKGIRSDARKVAAILRSLNDGAIYSKETFPLTFDLGEKTLAWKGPDGEKKERMDSLSSVALQSKGEIREGEATVFFGPMGLQENVDVRLTDGDRRMTVSFNAVSGRAKVMAEDGR
jgi:general secretion pathway protein H